jgi:hypothetical protein
MKRLAGLVGMLFMSFSVHAQQDALRPFVPPNAEIKLGTVLTGQLLVGRKDAWAGAPDFFCRQSNTQASLVNHPLADGSPKCYARSLVLGDIGDAPDLVLRRAGPDDADYNASPAPVAPGTNLGSLYWQAWGGRCEPGQYGYWSGCGGNGRTAVIYSRSVGVQTATSRAGSLHLATTPLGNNGSPEDRLVLSEDGRVIINTLAGMKQIEIGSADSCGTGYRCLRVAN